MKKLPYPPKIVVNELEYRRDILKRITHVIDLAISNFGKVLAVRLDLHLPKDFPYSGLNREISALIQRVRQYYDRKSRGGVHFIWVRERSLDNPNPHYHLLLLLDGKLRQFGEGVFKVVQTIWSRIVGQGHETCTHLCRTSEGDAGIVITSPPLSADNQAMNEAISRFRDAYFAVKRWASYLAKTYTKGNAPWHVHEFQSSRVHSWKRIVY